jgi:hypothetical protein
MENEGTLPERTLDGLLTEINSGKQYLVIGENHSDWKIANLVIPLLYNKKVRFKNLFMEALASGAYYVRGDELKDVGGVYGWNPLKYDRIISAAVNNDIWVYGIDSHKRVVDVAGGTLPRNGVEAEIRSLRIIKGGFSGKSIVLTGNDDVNYFKDQLEKSSSVPRNLVNVGVPEDSILTVSTIISEKTKAGLYKTKNLPGGVYFDYLKKHKVSDYVFIRRLDSGFYADSGHI